MTLEEYSAQKRQIATELRQEVLRLMRADADILEIARDMMVVARDEIRKSPSRLFQVLGAADPGASTAGLGNPAAGISGGQSAAGTPGSTMAHLVIDLIEYQKILIENVYPKPNGGTTDGGSGPKLKILKVCQPQTIYDDPTKEGTSNIRFDGFGSKTGKPVSVEVTADGKIVGKLKKPGDHIAASGKKITVHATGPADGTGSITYD